MNVVPMEEEAKSMDLSKASTSKERKSESKKSAILGSGPIHDGKAMTIVGHIYQLNLLMLFLKRASKEGYIFNLGTEVSAAGKFDDLVFKYEDKDGKVKYRFLQAKSKENYSFKITKDNLTNETEGPFSIQKYFMSYLKMKNASHQLFIGEYEDFILCTHIDIDCSLEESFSQMTHTDPLLGFDDGQCSKPPKRLKLKKNTPLYNHLKEKFDKLFSTQHPDYYQIAQKLGTTAAKAFAIGAKNNVIIITIEQKFKDNKVWMMAHIFDENTKAKTVNKPKFKLRSDFLYPKNNDLKEVSETFIEAYLTYMKDNTKQNMEKILENKQEMKSKTQEQIAEIKHNLSVMEFQLADSFLKLKQKNKTVSVETDVDMFLNKLVLAVNQPTEEELKVIVEDEIGDYMNLIDGELVVNKLQCYILDWAKKRRRSFIQQQDCFKFFTEVENQLASWGQLGLTVTHKQQIDKYGCSFHAENKELNNINTFLNKEKEEQILLVYCDILLLTEIKLMQLRKDAKVDEFMFSNINEFIGQIYTKVCPIKAFNSRTCNQMFISLNSNYESEISMNHLLTKLFEILSRNPNKKIVILVPHNLRDEFDMVCSSKNTVKSLLKKYKYVQLEDLGNKFEDLSLTTQNKIMNEAILKFQGCSVTLGKLIDENLKSRINGDILLKLVQRDLKFQVDDTKDSYNEDYFLERCIKRHVTISRKITEDERFLIMNDYNEIDIAVDQEILLITETDNKWVFEEICNKYKQIIHWLKIKNQEYIWLESRGSPNNLRKHVSDLPKSEWDQDYDLFATGPVDSDLIKKSSSHCSSGSCMKTLNNFNKNIKIKPISDINDRIVIISAEPGMGKSTILSYLVTQNKIQENQEDSLCMIKVNLEPYSKDFKQASNIAYTVLDAISFIYKVSKLGYCSNTHKSNPSNSFQIRTDKELTVNSEAEKNMTNLDLIKIKLFVYLYNARKLVILVDGFDEIAPDYVGPVLALLKNLKHSKVLKIWVTTRPYMIQNDLENQLCTFSYKFEPLTQQQQLLFFKKFWKARLNIEIPVGHVESFLRQSLPLNLMQNSATEINSHSAFMGIPQHILMVATIYEDKFNEYFTSVTNKAQNDSHIKPKKITRFELYKNFFLIKFKNCYREVDFNNPKYKKYREDQELFKENETKHRTFALIELFAEIEIPNELILNQHMQKQEFLDVLIKSVTSGEEKTGLLICDSNGHLRFVHRTYAEFFVADLLADALLNKESPEKHRAAKYLLHRFLTGPFQASCILTFFNCKVVSTSDHVDIFNDTIEERFDHRSPLPLLYSNIRDPLGRSLLHFVFCSDNYNCRDLMFTLGDNFSCLFEQDKLFNWSPLHYAIACHDCTKGRTLYYDPGKSGKIDNEIELKDDFGLTPYSLAARRGCAAYCIHVFLKELPINIDVQDGAGMTALHYAASRSDTNATLFTSMLIDMGADVSLPNNNGETPFDIIVAQKIYVTLHALANSILVRKRFQIFTDILTKEITKNIDFCVFVFSIDFNLTKILLENTIFDINVRDTKGKTALHHAFDCVIRCDPYDKCSDILFRLLKHGANINVRDDEGKLPSYFDSNEIMNIFARGQDPKMFTDLNDMVGKGLNVMKPFVLSMELNTDISVHILSRYKYIAHILITEKTNVNVQDSHGKTALHYAVILLRPQNLVFLLENGANLLVIDNASKTPFEYFKKTFYIKRGQIILLCLLKYGAYFDVNTSLLENDDFLKSIKKLFEAVKAGNDVEVKSILQVSKEVESLVNAKSKSCGRSPLHYAIVGKHKEIVKLLLSYGAICLLYDENVTERCQEIEYILILVKEIFLAIQDADIERVLDCIKQSEYNETTNAIVNAGYKNVDRKYGAMIFQPLHLAIRCGNADIVEILLKNGAKTNTKTSGETNVLHIACTQSKTVMQSLLNSISLEELYELFLMEDIDEKTPLITAVLHENTDSLKVLLQKCTFYEYEDKFDEYKIMTYARNACVIAESKSNKDLIDTVQKFYKKCKNVWPPWRKMNEQILKDM